MLDFVILLGVAYLIYARIVIDKKPALKPGTGDGGRPDPGLPRD